LPNARYEQMGPGISMAPAGSSVWPCFMTADQWHSRAPPRGHSAAFLRVLRKKGAGISEKRDDRLFMVSVAPVSE
jgi:hypothetical protein